MLRRPIARTVGRTALIAGTATVVSGGVRRRQESRWEDQEAAAAPPPPEYAAPEAPAGPSSDDIERLQQLASLKSQGVLTDEEFAAEKAKILNS